MKTLRATIAAIAFCLVPFIARAAEVPADLLVCKAVGTTIRSDGAIVTHKVCVATSK
jgi:hypothetical protein